MAESLPHGHRPKRNPVIYIYPWFDLMPVEGYITFLDQLWPNFSVKYWVVGSLRPLKRNFGTLVRDVP